MMDVLGVYERPYDPKRPVVCLDEKSKQLLEDARHSLPVQPGQIKRRDYEYIRHGTVNCFVAVEPKGKRRFVIVRKRKKKLDFAAVIKYLLTGPYKDVEMLVLVVDNLNTHNENALIETYGEEEGKILCDRIEWHYTPKHGSWLDMAEIEIAVLSKQCLKKAIATIQKMRHNVACWVKDRNRREKGINWTFTREKAAKKFNLDYPLYLKE